MSTWYRAMESNHRSEFRRLVYFPLYERGKPGRGCRTRTCNQRDQNPLRYQLRQPPTKQYRNTLHTNTDRGRPVCLFAQVCFYIGATDWTRTSNAELFRLPLYHWSYSGMLLGFVEVLYNTRFWLNFNKIYWSELGLLACPSKFLASTVGISPHS